MIALGAQGDTYRSRAAISPDQAKQVKGLMTRMIVNRPKLAACLNMASISFAKPMLITGDCRKLSVRTHFASGSSLPVLAWPTHGSSSPPNESGEGPGTT